MIDRPIASPDHAPDDAPVASPCISICRMDAALGDEADRGSGGLCTGCLRTIDEIVEWGGATNARKRAIVAAAAGRRLTAGPRPDPAP